MKTIPIEIPLSKKKIFLFFILSILFVVAGFWFVIKSPKIDSPIWGNIVMLHIAGVCSIVFFGFCTIYLFKKLFNYAPGLILNDEGIIDNSGAFDAELIEWKDITGFQILKVKRQKIIMVVVKNPEEYINNQKNRIKKLMMKSNYSLSDAPFHISANGLKCSFAELWNLLNDELNKRMK